MSIALVIPHILEREGTAMYAECLASVQAQSRRPDQLIIEVDVERSGCAATQNRALARVESEWIALLGDDDYLLPHHLETLEANASADVLWPDCLMLGDDRNLCQEFDAEGLLRDNYIPGGGSLIRASAVRAVGGWAEPDAPDWHRFEDWVLWKRLLNAGYTFRHIHKITWAYRFGAHQTSGLPTR